MEECVEDADSMESADLTEPGSDLPFVRGWRPLDLFLPTSNASVSSPDVISALEIAPVNNGAAIVSSERTGKTYASDSLDDREHSASNSQDESVPDVPVPSPLKRAQLRSKFGAIFDAIISRRNQPDPVAAPSLCDCSLTVDVRASPMEQMILLSGSICGALMERGHCVYRCVQPLSSTEYYFRSSICQGVLTPLCATHRHQLRLHLACPVCGIFIEKGPAAACLGADKDSVAGDRPVHMFHRSCAKLENKSELPVTCPHCYLKNGNIVNVAIYPIGEQKLSTAEAEITAATFAPEISVPKGISHRMSGSDDCLTVDGLWRTGDITRMSSVIEAPRDLKSESALAENLKKKSIVDLVEEDELLGVASYLSRQAKSLNDDVTLQPALFRAVQKNRLLCIHMFRLFGVPLDTADQTGTTPIMEAVLHGYLEIARYLKEFKCALDTRNRASENVLQVLLKRQQYSTVCRLLEDGLTTPDMMNVLCSDQAGDVVVPMDLRAYVEQFLPVAMTSWRDFEDALEKHSDVEKACRILASDPTEILKQPFEKVQELCKKFPQLLDLMEGLYYENDDPAVFPDISYGKEQQPIPMYGRPVGKAKLPSFTYIPKCVFPDDVQPTAAQEKYIQCSCRGKCAPNICDCRRTGTRVYNDDGLLSTCKSHGEYLEIYECNEFCLCGPNCGNRVAQAGVTCSFRIQKSTGRGWGLFAASFIPAGKFLAEYAGEIILDKEADKRKQEYMYLFELSNHKTGQGYCIDASRKGNVSRFLNHSCDPNAGTVVVYSDTQDQRFPTIGMFAIRDISAGEEICFDYGQGFWRIHSAEYTCQCGAYTCSRKDTSRNPTAARLLSPSRQPESAPPALSKATMPKPTYSRAYSSKRTA